MRQGPLEEWVECARIFWSGHGRRSHLTFRARPLEVQNDVHSGLLARVRGSTDPRAMRASLSSRVGGGGKGHSESLSTVHGSSCLGIAGALDMSSPCDAQQPKIPDPRTRDAGQMGTL
eukprot:1930844-Pleurochrysis_carterae.AAC.2